MRQATLTFGQRRSDTNGNVHAASDAAAPPKSQASKVNVVERSDVVKHDSNAAVNKAFAGKSYHQIFNKQDKKQVTKKAMKEADVFPSVDVPQQKPAPIPTLFRKRPQTKETPWPGKGESHVQAEAVTSSALASTSRIPLERLPRKNAKFTGDPSSEESVWPWNSTHLEEHSSVRTSSAKCDTHRAKTPTLPSHLWTELSRPRCSADVLGNEQQARYLRDWLRVLQVTGGAAALTENGKVSNGAAEVSVTKQMIIKRALKKRKRNSGARGEMDDFLVGDTEEEEAWFDQFRAKEECMASTGDADPSGCNGDDNYDFTNAAHVTNLIVLTGPSGTGKTASVYACAEELGFEVFEIYAGMGKRSGHSIMSLVGDLCLNHMVTSGGMGGGAFKGEVSNVQRLPFGTKATSSPTKNGLASRPRQSLILFEEVDVLYEEDKGFWPAIIELAAQSRRPIVLTCNDIDAVPIGELPVQRVLHFRAAATEEAAKYLNLVACRNGRTVDRETVNAVYDDKVRLAEYVQHDEGLRVKLDGTLHPASALRYSTADRCDLRQSLMQLQYLCAVRHNVKNECQDPEPSLTTNLSLRKSLQSADCRSAGDVISKRSHGRSAELLEPEQFGISSDDVQLPSTDLHKNTPSGNEIALAEYGREDDFARALGLVTHDGVGEGLTRTTSYHQRRLGFSKTIDALCKELDMPLQVRPPSCVETTLDYVGVIHKMIKFDDAEEAAHNVHVAQLVDEARKLQQSAAGSTSDAPMMATAAAGLARIGIRTSRQSSRLLLQRDENGILQLGRRQPDFFRYITLDDELVTEVRTLAPAVDW